MHHETSGVTAIDLKLESEPNNPCIITNGLSSICAYEAVFNVGSSWEFNLIAWTELLLVDGDDDDDEKHRDAEKERTKEVRRNGNDAMFDADAMSDEAMDDEAMDDEAMDDEAMDDEAMDDEAMDDDAMSDEAMDDEAMNDEAMNDEAMNDEAMDDEAMNDEEVDRLIFGIFECNWWRVLSCMIVCIRSFS